MVRGYAYALIAAVLYGLQYTPVKAYPVYDGSKFQWFMSCGIAFSGLVAPLVMKTGPIALIPHGIVGGALWGTANVLVLPTVKFLGLGVGFAMYHSINMAVGYAIGRFGLFGAPVEVAANPPLRDAGLALLIVSLIFMILVEPEIVEPAEDTKFSAVRQQPMTKVEDSLEKLETLDNPLKSRMDLLLDAAALKRASSSTLSTFAKKPSLELKKPGLTSALSVDQLDELSVNAGAKSARKAYANWRKGKPHGLVESSSGIVGAKHRHTRELVEQRLGLWPLFSEKDTAMVRSRYRAMLSGADADNRGLRSATLRALSISGERKRWTPTARSHRFDTSRETDRLMTADAKDDIEAADARATTAGRGKQDKKKTRFSVVDDKRLPSLVVDRGLQASSAALEAAGVKKQRFIIGGCCGVVAGVFCGVNMLPYVLFIAQQPDKRLSWNQTGSFIFSQTFGVFLAATFCLGLFTFAARLLDIELKSPAIWPPWFAGTLWVAGFVLAALAVEDLGMAQAYTYDAIGPVMLSALISFCCGEIIGILNTLLFLLALGLQTAGVLFIAYGA